MDALVAQLLANEAVVSDEARSTEFDIMMREVKAFAERNGYTEPLDPWEVVQALSKHDVKLSSWCGDEYGFSNVSLRGALLEWMKKQEIEKLEEIAKAEAKALRKKTVRRTTSKRKVVVKSDDGNDDDSMT